MTTQYSTGLKNYLAVTGSLLAAMNNCNVGIWSGPVPASPDVAVDGSCVLLATINNGGTPGTFDATPSNGVLLKTPSENWSGAVAATGTATFWRAYVPATDATGSTADASLVYHRVQGAVGIDSTAEMILPSVSLTAGQTQDIDQFQLS